LIEKASKLLNDESDPTIVVAMDAWNYTDFVYKNYILNGLDNTLYDLYSSIKNARALWEALNKNYKAKDAEIKKFIVNFFGFQDVDSKTMINQVKEFQLLLHDIHDEGISLNESSKWL